MTLGLNRAKKLFTICIEQVRLIKMSTNCIKIMIWNGFSPAERSSKIRMIIYNMLRWSQKAMYEYY